MRYDIISDTHGFLEPDLLDQLQGADVIVHAGDICSGADYRTLQKIAPVQMCLGNNDWAGEYGPEVTRKVRFEYEGLQFCVCHYRQDLTGERFDVGVFGHTHVPERDTLGNGALVMNPGSPTFPRSSSGPTMGRIYVEDGRVLSSEIIKLGDGEDRGWGRSFFAGW